jgi:hypothetical protein
MWGSLTPGNPLRTQIFARLRVRNVFVSQNFGATELMDANGFHGAVS